MLNQRKFSARLSLARLLATVLLAALVTPTLASAQAGELPATPLSGQAIFLPMVVGPQGAEGGGAVDAAATDGDLLITGVIDGPLTNGLPKAVEFYVVNAIPDLSIYGFGSANNGGGSDGEEYSFPSGSVAAGTFIYVATESPSFQTFFGFPPTYINGNAPNINGDDAIELFTNGVVTDIFGQIDVDGTGQPWDHLDGWTYRVDGTGPDGSTFVLANWTFSGINALDGETSNGSAAVPFPIGSYTAGPAVDNPPAVTSTSPADGATNVTVDAAIVINFNESVDLTAAAVTLACPSGTQVAFGGLPQDNVTSVTLTPDADLPANTQCAVTVVAAQVTDNDGTVDPMTTDRSFSFTTGTPVAAGAWVINELQADPDATLGDANGDGAVDTGQDEFVELVNNSGAAVDISGWTLADGNSVRHIFPAGTVVPDQCAVVVFGGGTPTGGFGGATAQTASGGQLGLNNGGDTVTLNNGSVDVASYVYGGEGGDNQSLTRSPDITGTDPLVKHTSVAGTRFSPGTLLDGTTFAGCAPPPAVSLKIHEVQGSGAGVTSPNALTTVEAIVVGDFQADDQLRGFFVQEEDADVDADAATSEGIFVFCGACLTDVSVSDQVEVTGTQVEFFGMSQLDASAGNVRVLSSGNALPTASSLTLPLDAAAYEPFEGMLVSFPQELTVAEYFQLARYGQITLHQGGRMEQFTNANAPDAAGYAAHLVDKARRTVILDDDNNRQNAPLGFTDGTADPAKDRAIYHPTPGGFSTSNYFRGGDTITDLTGVLHWSFAGQGGTDAWRVRPVPEAHSYAFTPANPRPAAPSVGGNIQVASFNVLNYFNGDGSGGGFPTARGAHSPAEFTRQTDKIVAAIIGLDADVIGLMEIENDYADGANSAIADLTAALNVVAGSGVYGHIDPGANVGTDQIAVGLLYKTNAVTPLGGPAILDTPAFVNPNTPGSPKNRPAIAQSFRVSDSANPGEGEIFTVAVNHLKSKGSGCGAGDDDPDTGQGSCNDTRTKAAQELVTWLAADPTGSGDPDTLIIGDLNAYAKEDPITALKNAGYTDLLDVYSGGDAYGYVFDGEIGYLDHALANPALAAQVTGATHWHINADEVNVLDYNDSVQDTGESNFDRKTTVNVLYAADAFRSSDHDPVLIGLGLSPDTGNLPASYRAARHNGPGINLYLGSEWGGASNDSVGSLPGYDSSGSYALEVVVRNTGSRTAQLVGWVDWDESGSFEPHEMSRPALATPLPAGCDAAGATDDTFTTGNIAPGCVGTIILQWSGITATPAQLFARIRLTTDEGTFGGANFFSDASPAPAGLARDGEVEDFATVPLAVTIGYVAATRSGESVDYLWQTATETAVAGFNIVAETVNGLTQLNDELIASKVIDSLTPTDYGFSAATEAEDFYIDEVDINGKRTRHGPFRVGETYGSYALPGGVNVEPTIWLPLILK